MDFNKYIKTQPRILSQREIQVAKDAWDSCHGAIVEQVEGLRKTGVASSARLLNLNNEWNKLVDQVVKELGK